VATQSGPQAQFNDLYSSVYAILDDAKKRHRLVKLYKGSHASANPHEVVTDFGQYFFRERRGLFSYACSRKSGAGPVTVEDLNAFDLQHRPRTSVRAAFDILSEECGRRDESPDDFLRYLVTREHSLGAYRGGSSGLDDEAQAFAVAHFNQLDFSVSMDDIMVFSGGFKGVFFGFCASLLCERNYEELRPLGGRILVPEGYYQSLRLIPPLLGAELSVTPDLTGESVNHWLQTTAGHPGRAVYVPIVNNANGRVLSRDRALGIALAILRYNQQHPDSPVYVLGDDVYEGSYLATDLDPQPIGAITGHDVGDATLGRMSDYTVTVTTPSKTFAYPTSRIAFVATTSEQLRNSLAHYRTLFSYGRVPQIDELTGIAALCLTPQSWVGDWNRVYRNKLAFLQAELANINKTLGFDAFLLDEPEGGWYATLRVSPKLFSTTLTSSVDAFSVLLHYGENRTDTGVALLPGELFGYRYRPDSPDDTFVLRGNLAVDFDDLLEATARLREMAFALRTWGPQIEGRAKQLARAVADVDGIVRRLRQ
jgi:aspartate/methionine/tyrosine aminotransferase